MKNKTLETLWYFSFSEIQENFPDKHWFIYHPQGAKKIHSASCSGITNLAFSSVVSFSNTIIWKYNVWPHPRKTFAGFIQQKKYQRKFVDVRKARISFFTWKMSSISKGNLQTTNVFHFILVQFIHLIHRHEKWWYSERRKWECQAKNYNFTLYIHPLMILLNGILPQNFQFSLPRHW